MCIDWKQPTGLTTTIILLKGDPHLIISEKCMRFIMKAKPLSSKINYLKVLNGEYLKCDLSSQYLYHLEWKLIKIQRIEMSE